jgi:hypothetical protein
LKFQLVKIGIIVHSLVHGIVHLAKKINGELSRFYREINNSKLYRKRLREWQERSQAVLQFRQVQ